MTPEQRLYTECINRHVIAAIWPFRLPQDKVPSIEDQYKKLLARKNPVIFYNNVRADAYKSMFWLETSSFDFFVEMADLGDRFLNKTFDFVQECVHMRNKLLREQEKSGKYKRVVQRKSKYDKRG